jgi:hypothetical protein
MGEECRGQRRVRNISTEVVVVEFATSPGRPPRRHRIEPGAFALVPTGYATRRARLDHYHSAEPAAETRPSIVEELTAGRVLPVDDPRATEFMQGRTQ